MKKLLFAFNPHAGKARIRYELLGIIDRMNRAGYETTVAVSQYGGHVTEIIEKDGAQYDRIVTSGGDGTLCEAINGLMKLDRKVELGYIPAGSTNDVAAGLGIPFEMQEAADVAVDGVPLELDVGRFNDRYFTYVAAFGAFTEVTYQTPQDIKNMLGHQAYILNAINYLADIHPISVKVTTAEGEEKELSVLYGMISNAKSVGGFKQMVGDGVDLSDGEFETLFILNPKNPLEIPMVVAELALGQHENPEHFFVAKTSEITVETEEEIGWVLDGEYGGTVNRAHIVNCRHAVTIMVPKQDEQVKTIEELLAEYQNDSNLTT